MAVPTKEQLSTTRVGKPRRSGTRANVIRHVPTKDFVYLVSPSEIDMVAGEALPRLVQFPIDGGLLGVPGSEDGEYTWRAAVATMCERQGRILVDPHEQGLTLAAFGKEITPDPDDDPTDPRSWYVCRYRGHKGIIHMPPWCKPRVIGSRVVWDKDPAGRIDFQRQIRDKVFGGIDVEIEKIARLEAEQLAVQTEAEAKHRPTQARNAEVTRAAVTRPTTSKEAGKRRK